MAAIHHLMKDLGYTYGYYTMTFKEDGSTQHGNYVSIWKKQAGGDWKFVLDTGNEGPEKLIPGFLYR